MFSPSTTSSIKCSVPGQETSLFAVVLEAPSSVPGRFRLPPSEGVPDISVCLVCFSFTIENQGSCHVIHVLAFGSVERAYYAVCCQVNLIPLGLSCPSRDNLTDLPG
jgi:hypothetical protein